MSIADPVSYYLDRFSAGDVDGAFFGLIELDCSRLEDLIVAYSREASAERRVFLLRVISEYRMDSSAPFLAERLLEDDPKIWRQALDGLVTTASPAAFEALLEAKSRCAPERLAKDRFGSWLDEAISQMRDRSAL